MESLVKMLRLSNTPTAPTSDGDEISAEADEPPDDRKHRPQPNLVVPVLSPYTKAKATTVEGKKESLLTKALMSSPEPSPVEYSNMSAFSRTSPPSVHSNVSGPSTAELTSDGETKSPPRSNTPSPPLPSGFGVLHPTGANGMKLRAQVVPAVDTHESQIEANLGRKRCITFACGRKLNDEEKASSEPVKNTNDPPKRKTMLTFACPSRPTGDSDSKLGQTTVRKGSVSSQLRNHSPVSLRKSSVQAAPSKDETKRLDVPRVSGLGGFELSDATRFHEFGSSLDDDDWVNHATNYKDKITLSDCMKKENAIRKLGEEVEEEARQDEEDQDEDDDDEEEDDAGADDNDDDDDDDDDGGDDDDDDDEDDEDEDGFSDDGNESDNEAGFADSDESDDESEYEFWVPSMATAATSIDHLDIVQQDTVQRNSYTSVDSLKLHDDEDRIAMAPPPKPTKKRRQSSKAQKHRPGTPNLPDSTDFVCGTLDEDRPLEAAYKSCMEERRRAKHVLIPQDIDPSFPTTDSDDDGDGDGDQNDEIEDHNTITERLNVYDSECLRGRQKGDSRKTSPSHSPKRLQSPRRLRSPPPTRSRLPPPIRRPSLAAVALHPPGINISGLAQRPNRRRTRSLPRTPNPFFARLERRRSSKTIPVGSPGPRRRNIHTRGAIDIVEGLEKKRQKRKEKFWRQHKAAKEQHERKPLLGKGAERMKELGLEVKERCRAYGVGQGAQLVLSI
ncbi:hypothetical protein FQN51_007122 [Onygenales sp. PD_10]|nr:hypothetical protein FQN51_007122 [Onygenales sp. PD_10]